MQTGGFSTTDHQRSPYMCVYIYILLLHRAPRFHIWLLSGPYPNHFEGKKTFSTFLYAKLYNSYNSTGASALIHLKEWILVWFRFLQVPKTSLGFSKSKLFLTMLRNYLPFFTLILRTVCKRTFQRLLDM